MAHRHRGESCSTLQFVKGRKVMVRQEPGPATIFAVLVLALLFPVLIAGYGKFMAGSREDRGGGPLVKFVDHSYRALDPLPRNPGLAVVAAGRGIRSS